MPKDYKNINKSVKKPSQVPGNLLSFVTGLTVGLFIAFLVYLYHNNPEKIPLIETVASRMASPEPVVEQVEQEAPDETNSTPPPPTFDFYHILPNREVSVSDWVAEVQEKDSTDEDKASLYLFQVGSFKEFSAADQVKARLALIGISADIQRVVINGQDVHHRVRVGPYKKREKISEIRERLMADNLEFMLLKLEIDE